MTDPQNPNPWQHPYPQNDQDPEQTSHGAQYMHYEVSAANRLDLPTPQDNAQWQSPAPYSDVGAQHVQYHVAPVNNLAFPMPPMTPALPQEMGPARPSTITAAMWIWIAGAVLSVALGPVLMLGNMDYLLAQDSSLVTAEDRRAGELAFQIMTVVVGFGMLIAAAPYIAFAVVLRNGQNWARILLTILGMFGLVTMVALLLVGLQAPQWQAGVTISTVVIGLTVAAVVLQFLPASNKYVR